MIAWEPPKKYQRSQTYRSDLIRNYPTVKGKYRCVYCGRLIERRDMVVDHIIPVRSAQTSSYARRLLHGRNVNDLSNLAPACHRCNMKKGSTCSKTWIKKARKGKKESYWRYRKTKRIILFLIGAFYLYMFFVQPETLGKMLLMTADSIKNIIGGLLSTTHA